METTNIQELEQLRSEMREFKSRLEQQEIVSKRLLTEATRGRVSWIKKCNVWVSIVGLCFLPVVIALLRVIDCSWTPIVFFSIMVVGESLFNFWNSLSISDRRLMAGDIVGTRQRLLAYKRREQRQMMVEVPMIVLWFVWVVFDVSRHSAADTDRDMGITLLVGGVLGLIFASIVFVREIRSLNRAVRQIDEFTDN